MKPKFRAWLKEEYWMTDVREITFFNDEVQMISDVEGFYPYYEFELMQSTGLRDKNGKEIFEGDIVKYKSKKGTFTDIATYSKFYAFFGLKDDTGDLICSFDWLLENVGKDGFEVIGNIYENPELLEGEE